MTVREWSKLDYLSPEKILLELRGIALNMPLNELPYEVASLRKRSLRSYGEGRQCALFCYLIGKALDINVKFSLTEKSDYDCIAYFEREETNNFVPVQMKELVPDFVNPNASLQGLIDKLNMYVDSNDLVVAIHLNRTSNIDISKLSFENLNIGALWFFGAKKPDQLTWTLIGNLLKPNAKFYEIPYP